MFIANVALWADVYVSNIDQLSCFSYFSFVRLVVNLSTQPGQDLKVLVLVEVLSFLYLGGVGPPLLLCLASLDPLLHGKMLIQLCKIIRSQTQAIEDGTLDWIQDDMVVWSGDSQYMLLGGLSSWRCEPCEV